MADTNSAQQARYSYVFTEDFSEVDIVGSFRSAFPEMNKITTRDQVLLLVNLSDEVRDWYLDFKKFNATLTQKPDWLPATDESIKYWQRLKDGKLEIKEANVKWESRIAKASSALKLAISEVENEKKIYYKNLDPILVIDSFSVNNLPRKDLLEIALTGEEEQRSALIQDKVVKFKQSVFNKYIETGHFDNPYLK